MPETMISYFMKTRKGAGKLHTQAIIDFLQKQLSDYNGWVQARDLHEKLVRREKKIPEGPTLFRILADLTSYKVIERHEEIIPSSRSKPNKQKSSVFYRMSHAAYIDRVLTSQERDNVEHSMKIRMHELQFDFMAAKKVLENHGLFEEFERMKENDEFANYREFIEDYR